MAGSGSVGMVDKTTTSHQNRNNSLHKNFFHCLQGRLCCLGNCLFPKNRAKCQLTRPFHQDRDSSGGEKREVPLETEVVVIMIQKRERFFDRI